MLFCFFFSTWKWHPRCGLNLLETIPWVQVVDRGSSEPLSFAPLPSDWTSSNLGGILTFWHGALVPLDLFPDFTPGRGFTLALLWMIPTTCIPAGRMVLGVDDLREFLRPTAFAVALLSTRTGPYGRRGSLMSLQDLPHWDHIVPFAVRIRPLRHWKRCLLPANRDASHRSGGSSTCRGRLLIHYP